MRCAWHMRVLDLQAEALTLHRVASPLAAQPCFACQIYLHEEVQDMEGLLLGAQHLTPLFSPQETQTAARVIAVA